MNRALILSLALLAGCASTPADHPGFINLVAGGVVPFLTAPSEEMMQNGHLSDRGRLTIEKMVQAAGGGKIVIGLPDSDMDAIGDVLKIAPTARIIPSRMAGRWMFPMQ